MGGRRGLARSCGATRGRRQLVLGTQRESQEAFPFHRGSAGEIGRQLLFLSVKVRFSVNRAFLAEFPKLPNGKKDKFTSTSRISTNRLIAIMIREKRSPGPQKGERDTREKREGKGRVEEPISKISNFFDIAQPPHSTHPAPATSSMLMKD